MPDEAFYNRVSGDRIGSRQIDELIGLARGLLADDVLNQSEVEFLQKWLAANMTISDQPMIGLLYDRVASALGDGMLDQQEHDELFDTLNSLSDRNIELGEVLKSSTLPLCNPAPDVEFAGRNYVFTGTFEFGQRKDCERAVAERGGLPGTLTRNTHYLVIGVYATESWKHSAMGNKILKACDLRDQGLPISIISEEHWRQYL